MSTLSSKQVEENPSKKETHGLCKIIRLTSELHKGCNFGPTQYNGTGYPLPYILGHYTQCIRDESKKQTSNLPEKHHNKNSIAVKVVQNHVGQPLIIPVTMNKEQALQEPELAQCKIRCHDCLPAFLATDANTHICHLDH